MHINILMLQICHTIFQYVMYSPSHLHNNYGMLLNNEDSLNYLTNCLLSSHSKESAGSVLLITGICIAFVPCYSVIQCYSSFQIQQLLQTMRYHVILEAMQFSLKCNILRFIQNNFQHHIFLFKDRQKFKKSNSKFKLCTSFPYKLNRTCQTI